MSIRTRLVTITYYEYSFLRQKRTRQTIRVIDPGLEYYRPNGIDNNNRVIVHTRNLLHEGILFNIVSECEFEWQAFQLTPPCQAWRSLRSPALPSTVY